MSSGFFSFYAHCGVACALQDKKLHPNRITGSSAGALIGACLSANKSAWEIRELLLDIEKAHFWDPGFGLGLLKGQRFKNLLSGFIGIEQFSECSIPLSVSAYHARSRATEVLSSGDLATAVLASCAVPLLIQPARINDQLYWDGGIKDRHGLAATEPGERIFYHHIASRSPWRRANSRALQVPRQNNLTSLVIKGLPRCSPTKLEHGHRALELAYESTLQALQSPMQNHSIEIQANNRSGDSGEPII